MMKTKVSHGQTLIEALITVLLITFSTIALIRFQNYLAYDNSLSQQKSEAIILASQRLEELRDYQVLNNLAGYTSYQSIASGSTTVSGSAVSYNVSWTITASTNPAYKLANVTVSWVDRYNVSQSVQLITILPGIDPTNSAIIM